MIPALNENQSENDPMAIRIKKIVAEEKQKFNGVVEFLKGNQTVQSDKTKNNSDDSQYICKNYSYDSSEAKMIISKVKSKELNISDVGHASETLQNKIFQCFFCHQTFLELPDCQKHLQRRSLYFCKDCNINFCDEQSNYLHSLLKHNIIMNKCDICKQSFVTKELLLQHLSYCKNSTISSNILVVSPTIFKTFNDNVNCILKIDENSCSTLNETVSNCDTSAVHKTCENGLQMCFENAQSFNFIEQRNYVEESQSQEKLQFPIQKLLLQTYFNPFSNKTLVSGDLNTADSSVKFEAVTNKSVCHREETIGNTSKGNFEPVTVTHLPNASEETSSYITINDKSNINNVDNTGRVIVIETTGNSIFNLPIVNSRCAAKNTLDDRTKETNFKSLPVTSSRISKTDKTFYETCEVIKLENWLSPPTLSERFSKNSEEFKKYLKNEESDLDEWYVLVSQYLFFEINKVHYLFMFPW